MNIELAFEKVIAYVDEKMAESPSQELADLSNRLEEMKAEL